NYKTSAVASWRPPRPCSPAPRQCLPGRAGSAALARGSQAAQVAAHQDRPGASAASPLRNVFGWTPASRRNSLPGGRRGAPLSVRKTATPFGGEGWAAELLRQPVGVVGRFPFGRPSPTMGRERLKLLGLHHTKEACAGMTSTEGPHLPNIAGLACFLDPSP
ncbi:unnamed protein product, partial [Amoebophrya sp. A120]